MKKIVLFDIDYTLFNTLLFRRNLYQSLVQISKKSVGEIKKMERSIALEVNKKFGYLHFSSYVEKLAQNLGEEKKGQEILSACMDKNLFDKSIYTETKGVIQELSKKSLIGVFSKGDTLFQLGKISAIQDYFHKKHIHIMTNKHKGISTILSKYANYRVYLVDDALDILYLAKKKYPNIVVIWVKRGRFAKNQKPIESFTPDATIFSLKKVVKLIN